MSDTTSPDRLELAEKLLKLANLEIDTLLKRRQFDIAPWQLVISALSVGAAIGGVAVGAILGLMKYGAGGMTPDTLRDCLDALRWSQRGLASALGCDDRLVRRWASGDATIPPSIAAWIETLAGAHRSNPAPTDWRVREPA